MSLPRLAVLASAALLCVVSLVSASPFQSPNRFLGTDVSPALSRRGGSRVYSSAALLEVTLDYKADSGGCRPLTNYEKHSKDSEWWDWEKRLESLASKVAKKKKPGQKAATVLNGLGDKNMWVQIVDGWAHLKGKDAFGPEYVTDMKRSFKACTELLTNEQVNARDYNVKAYDKLHHTAFEKTAHLLSKPNGFRGPHTGVYLPLPDKPLGVFHDIHENGKMTYNPKLRRIDRNSGASTGWKHNSGYLMRWVYPNLEIEFEKKKVQELFDHFWKLVGPEHIPSDWSKGQKRAARLDAIVWLYHSLENFHCFIDGNGRSNVLVLDTLLSWAGLHPVSFYNSMESALSSVAELREKVLEGYFMWEEAYLRIEQKKDFISGWNLKAIKGKNKECARAIDVLFGKEEPLPGEFVPDTLGGCVCVDSSTCDSNEKHRGRQWCFTTKNCTWKWDYCAKGRPRTHDSDHGHEESHHSDVLIPDLKFE